MRIQLWWRCYLNRSTHSSPFMFAWTCVHHLTVLQALPRPSGVDSLHLQKEATQEIVRSVGASLGGKDAKLWSCLE